VANNKKPFPKEKLDRLLIDLEKHRPKGRAVAAFDADGTLWDTDLGEVFKNLIENSIKFNDKAKKEIVIDGEAKAGAGVLRVTDNGVGIPPEEREKIFEKFYQIENSFTGQVPGAGLGLALCKKVIEALGGEIHLESEIGKGTRVSLSLPRGKTNRIRPRAH
jgi:signal transduction histidine kinase